MSNVLNDYDCGIWARPLVLDYPDRLALSKRDLIIGSYRKRRSRELEIVIASRNNNSVDEIWAWTLPPFSIMGFPNSQQPDFDGCATMSCLQVGEQIRRVRHSGLMGLWRLQWCRRRKWWTAQNRSRLFISVDPRALH